MINLYDFSSYEAYLKLRLGAKGQRRGLKSAAAKHMGCSTTYISQVLNGPAHLTLEQAEKLNSFFEHTVEESHYFLLLVQKDRAGSLPLKEYFQNQLSQVLKDRLNLKKRASTGESISKMDEAIYYSSWHFAAVHVALSIPKLQRVEELSQYFGLSQKRIQEVLKFLISLSLADESGGEFRIGRTHIHLGSDSPNVSRHHANWRLKVLQKFENISSDDLHYSSAVSLAQKDVAQIKEILAQALKEANTRIASSKEEKLYGLCFDFFEVK